MKKKLNMNLIFFIYYAQFAYREIYVLMGERAIEVNGTNWNTHEWAFDWLELNYELQSLVA